MIVLDILRLVVEHGNVVVYVVFLVKIGELNYVLLVIYDVVKLVGMLMVSLNNYINVI
jgi:hypothetical protein